VSTDTPDISPPAETEQPTKLTYAERKQARFQLRVEKWEDRLTGPPPPRYLHRAIITIVMMLAMLALLWLLLFTGPPV